FDGRVRSQSAAPGQVVGPGTAVAVLYATDLVEVEVGLPVADLRWITVPGDSARVVLDTGQDTFTWKGWVHRTVGVLDDVGRLARVVVRIADPFGPSEPGRRELSIGSFVTVEIEGRILQDVVAVPRRALHPSSMVWIAREDSTLDMRRVETAWTSPEEALISGGIQEGERIILSPLSGAVPGMALRPIDAEES
ncbi:MAG: HlyD family efflux transporter periplasmic adaptor subunit, partial [Candidatus Eisenbacteria bacterium]|nr:HlyD family efflux transporter periplasmic adaptor subunit [Candidatus Eisenbacteria bacterium]